MNRSNKYSEFSPLTDLDNLSKTLETYGVAVLPNVFGDQECENLKRSVLGYIEKNHGVTEPNDFKKLKPLRGGILHAYGISLLPEVLDMKTDERTIEPFRRIWEENEMTTSLDGMHIGPPPEFTTERNFFRLENTWFHTDQASDKNFKCCIQAYINLESIETGDGCLSVLTNSHKYHSEFFRHFNLSSRGRDWFLLNKTNHYDWFINKGCEWKMIMAPKGSMVFWDSRTIHMGTLPRAGRPNPERWRFIVYVCYTPARLQSKEDAKLKRMAYIENRCTAHWPYGVHVFHKEQDDLKENSLKNLSERHRLYLGIN